MKINFIFIFSFFFMESYNNCIICTKYLIIEKIYEMLQINNYNFPRNFQ